MEDNEEIIKKNKEMLEENLCVVRKIFGWTAENLAQKVGMARQTINNIENGKSKLTTTQYLAIKEVLLEEVFKIMKNSSESTATMRAIESLLKDKEIYPDEVKMLASVLGVVLSESNDSQENEIIINTAKDVAPALVTKTTSRKAVSKEFLKKAGAVAGGIIVAGITAYFLKGKNKE